MQSLNVPFFRPWIDEREIAAVAEVLKRGWLTTGPRVRAFEEAFARHVGGSHALAVNSCTAALHLAVEALGLRAGQGVLIPAMTFAATAEVVQYVGAVPILVDCDPVTLNMDLDAAETALARLRMGQLPPAIDPRIEIAGMIPVHVGGWMMAVDDLQAFARRHGLWIVEDAAHAFPAAWRRSPGDPWRRCGQNTADVTCFSFYANKTITTGEGGMAVTNRRDLLERMRLMSLHGLSRDAWDRYRGGGSWDYRIVAPGFKYNMTDVAAAIGLVQLEKAERMRVQREAIAKRYSEAFAGAGAIDLPPDDPNRIHSWHLYPIRLHLEKLSIDRNQFIRILKERGIGTSVHWRPLHLHPYYQEKWGWRPEDCPMASEVWKRLVSLPLYPGMTEEEIEYVIEAVMQILNEAVL